MFDVPKYILVDNNRFCMTMFIFPSHVAHNDFARIMGFNIKDIKSAGFVNMYNKTCYGKSISLRKECNQEVDSRILRRCFFQSEE